MKKTNKQTGETKQTRKKPTTKTKKRNRERKKTLGKKGEGRIERREE